MTKEQKEDDLNALTWILSSLILGGYREILQRIYDRIDCTPVDGEAVDIEALKQSAKRYEIVRKMSTQEFGAVLAFNLQSNVPFDTIIDNLSAGLKLVNCSDTAGNYEQTR